MYFLRCSARGSFWISLWSVSFFLFAFTTCSHVTHSSVYVVTGAAYVEGRFLILPLTLRIVLCCSRYVFHQFISLLFVLLLSFLSYDAINTHPSTDTPHCATLLQSHCIKTLLTYTCYYNRSILDTLTIT